MTTETKLAEFAAAQNAIYDEVRRELAPGRKETQRIWFVFSQTAGNIDGARDHLKRCFGIDPRGRLEALADADFEPPWQSLWKGVA